MESKKVKVRVRKEHKEGFERAAEVTGMKVNCTGAAPDRIDDTLLFEVQYEWDFQIYYLGFIAGQKAVLAEMKEEKVI